MYKYLSKFNFIKIIPFSETFFIYELLPKKIKISKELIALNYAKKSPIKKNFEILSIVSNKNLFLWFHTLNSESLILIPESYLYYQVLKQNSKDNIYVLHDVDYKVLVIKNGELVSCFNHDQVDTYHLNILKEEYAIENTIIYDQEQTKQIRSKLNEAISWRVLFLFSQYKFNSKEIVKKLLEKLAYPITLFIALIIIFDASQNSYLKNEIESLQKQYLLEKEKNSHIRAELNEYNKNLKEYKNFISKELISIDPFIVLDEIYKIMDTNKTMSLKLVNIANSIINIKLQTELNPTLFLNRVSKIKHVKNVFIKHTYKHKNKSTVISYEVVLKKREL